MQRLRLRFVVDHNPVTRSCLLLPLAALIAVWAPAFAQAPARETHADLPALRLWFKDSGGNGIPVVFLHSNTGSSRNAQSLVLLIE